MGLHAFTDPALTRTTQPSVQHLQISSVGIGYFEVLLPVLSPTKFIGIYKYIHVLYMYCVSPSPFSHLFPLHPLLYTDSTTYIYLEVFTS